MISGKVAARGSVVVKVQSGGTSLVRRCWRAHQGRRARVAAIMLRKRRGTCEVLLRITTVWERFGVEVSNFRIVEAAAQSQW